MVTIGAAIMWLSFGIVADGWGHLRGCTWEGGLKALLVPGEFAGARCHHGANASGGGAINTAAPLSDTGFRTRARCQKYAAAHPPGDCAKNDKGVWYFRASAGK